MAAKPFEEDEAILPQTNSNLKKVSSQPSMFDNLPKKPSQETFEAKVKEKAHKMSSVNAKASELVLAFLKALEDKTLSQNKSPIAKDVEKELLKNMVNLASDINSDPTEREGEGSLSWIALLLKTSFLQRDKINQLEYSISMLENKINKILDKSKTDG